MPRPRKSGKTKPPNIVNANLSPEVKAEFDRICDARGMTIKTLLGRLIAWFARLDKTEQAIVLGQIGDGDFESLAAELVKRRPR